MKQYRDNIADYATVTLSPISLVSYYNPIYRVAPASGYSGALATLTCLDPNPDDLSGTLTISGMSSDVTFSGDTVSGTFDPLTPGTYTAVVSVTDTVSGVTPVHAHTSFTVYVDEQTTVDNTTVPQADACNCNAGDDTDKGDITTSAPMVTSSPPVGPVISNDNGSYDQTNSLPAGNTDYGPPGDPGSDPAGTSTDPDGSASAPTSGGGASPGTNLGSGSLPSPGTPDTGNNQGISANLGGNGTSLSGLASLRLLNNGTIINNRSPINRNYFQTTDHGTTYGESFGGTDQLTSSGGNYSITDSAGTTTVYQGFDSSATAGAILSSTDAFGNTTTYSYDDGGKPTQVVTDTTNADGTVTRSATLLNYTSGLVSSIVLERKVFDPTTDPTGAGTDYATVQEADYTYYGSGSALGNPGDLQLAQVKDAAGNVTDTAYYQYYLLADNGGIAGQLRYVFGSDSYARLQAAEPGADPAAYADASYAYDSQGRIISRVLQGAGCSACAGGLGTFTFSYEANDLPISGYNIWSTKTTEDMPDGTVQTYYYNAYAELMLQITTDPVSGNSTGTFNAYDNSGRLIMTASPSAVILPDTSELYTLDASPTLLNYVSGHYEGLADDAGLISTTTYFDSTTATTTMAGGVAGYADETFVQNGQSGTPIPQETFDYIAAPAGSNVYETADDTVYGATSAGDARTTQYAYGWYGTTDQISSEVITLPSTSGQNGPSGTATETINYDVQGRQTSVTDANGGTSYTTYDDATGAVSSTTDALGRTTNYVVDALGRTTKVTDPNLNITYTVYDDADREIRVYPGFNAYTGATTGPIQVYLTYYPAAESDGVFYTEALTSSATPHLTDGVPDGTETIDQTNIQSLTRNFTNSAGQVLWSDSYANMSGITFSEGVSADEDGAPIDLGTSGTNFYRTIYGYDHEGRQAKVIEPTGTIDRDVYNGFGELISKWVGTDDTPTSGYWSTSNPAGMTEIETDSYDADGNLIETDQYPGNSQPTRITRTMYNWQDEPVETESGIVTGDTTTPRSIAYYTYDNQGEVTEQDTYNGSGIDIASLGYTGGVPNAPSSSLLIAKSTAAYDDQGQVYQIKTYSVTAGTASTDAITTNIFHDSNGNVLAIYTTGKPTTKYAYDADNRVTGQYTTDGGALNVTGTPSFADLTTITNDVVVSETDISYDYGGNAYFTVTKDRLSTDANTAVGALGDATTSPQSFNNYVASGFDRANRLVNQFTYGDSFGLNGPYTTTSVGTTSTLVDSALPAAGGASYVGFAIIFSGGTLGGQSAYVTADQSQTTSHSLTLSPAVTAAVPSGATFYLENDSPLTTYTYYDAAGNVLDTVDPKGIVTRYGYDMLGRQTQTIADYTDGTPTSDSNQTTAYTYDGNGDVLTMKAVMPSGTPSQTTKYVYGVGTGTGSTIFSNDLIQKVEYPDATTGEASTSSSDDVSYAYDNLGETLTKTDQNGSTHTYSYDPLGRLTLDAVTTLGTDVDGSVQALGYTYNALGLPLTQTSYDSPTTFTSGHIVNQVADVYDGLWRLSAEYQAVDGVADTSMSSATPKVQYVYSDLSDGSRLTEMVYPNARILHYGYDGNALDDAIGRVDYLADDDGSGAVMPHLVNYTYQGLNTFIGQSAGDGVVETTTLDNYGRIADMNYIKSGASTDHFAYGYDADGNVLYKQNEAPYGSNFSELYSYDSLNRLTTFARGTLNSDNTAIATPNTDVVGSLQDWSLDAVGNQTAVTTGTTTDTRNQNSKNELKGDGEATLGYDANGNTTTDENGNTLTYDAWNRMVTDSAGTTSYTYDANGRRVTETHGSTTASLYFSIGGQVLEKHVAGSVTAQNVWSIDYVNDLLLRDDNGTSGSLGKSESGLGNRVYYQHDANFNVTATMSSGGTVILRYVYTPYGVQGVLTETWATSSATNSIYGFQGGWFDVATALNHFGARDYDSATGAWTEQDIGGYVDGLDRYQFDNSDPISYADPLGMDPTPPPNGGTGIFREHPGPPLSNSEPVTGHGRLMPPVPKYPNNRAANPNPRTLTCPATKRIVIHGKDKVTAAEEDAAIAALARILNTNRGSDYLQQLDSDNRIVDVFLDTDGPTWSPNGSVYINVNVIGNLSVHVLLDDGTDGWVAVSWERALAHELGHAVFGVHDDGPGEMNNIEPNENPIVCELGGNYRLDHGTTGANLPRPAHGPATTTAP